MLLLQNVIRNSILYKDKPATIMGDRVRTWSELLHRVQCAATGLGALGVRERDRVGILALNSDRYFEALWAVSWLGAVAVPLNIRWSLEENIYSVKDAGLCLLIADDNFADLAKQVRARIAEDEDRDLGLIHMCDGEAADGFAAWDELVGRNEPALPVNVTYDSLSGIYYTGGTTGFPKGVMLSHMALWSSAITIVVETKFDADSVFLHAAPMFHLADGGFSNATTIAGGTHVFIPAFTPAATLRAIGDHGITTILLVPAMIRMLLEAPEFPEADISSLNTLVYGASPIPESILREALQVMPQVGFIQGYGQTEMAPIISLLPKENHVLNGPSSKLSSAGKPVSCIQWRLVDETGQDAAPGDAGELWVRGPNAMDGYWNSPEQTSETLVDGWVKTGDIAYQDNEGFLYICDRVKDMIITGGENVFSTEVESAIISHPKVTDVAVIGVPDDSFGERVHAIIVPVADAGEISLEEIYDHCHERIAGYKCPRSIEVRENPLPLSGTGKVLKKDLRKPHWEGRRCSVA